MLKRKAYASLLTWKLRDDEDALILRGPKRVGKTTLAKHLANKKYKSHIYIDFEKADNVLLSIFEDEIYDMDIFFLKLMTYFGVELVHKKSLIILDEVKNIKNIDVILKFILDDNRYHVMAISSDYSFPKDSNIRYKKKIVDLNPMDFEEFLIATGKDSLNAIIKTAFKSKRPMGAGLHKKAMTEFSMYMILGGMPEVVKKYIETKDLQKTESLKKDILENNKAMLENHKHAKKALQILERIGGELSKTNKIFKISTIDKKARFREYEKAFALLSDLGIIDINYNAENLSEGLKIGSNHFTRRCYMKDSGLLLTDMSKSSDDNGIISDIMFGNLYTHNGMFIKNIAHQMLLNNYNSCLFYSRVDKNERKNHMEVDLVFKDEYGLYAAEVKDGSFRKNSNLDKLQQRYRAMIRFYYVINLNDLKIIDNDTIELPIYMTSLL